MTSSSSRVPRTLSQGCALFAISLTVFTADIAPANACGGFLCSRAPDPPKQTDERILFIDHGDGDVTTVIHIAYEGDPAGFAWVLPVMGHPHVELSSTALFDRLAMATDPQFVLSQVDACGSPGDGPSGIIGAGGTGSAVVSTPVAPVALSMADSIGPYDYEIIEVVADHSDPGQAALDWLLANGYVADERAAEAFGPYLETGMNLMAFRLSGAATTADIQPVALTFACPQPMIPLVPTALGARDDMGVQVWVMGPSRAVTVNYRTVAPNPAMIDWLDGASNYRSLITAAANDGGGQAFVTEFAGTSEMVAEAVWSDDDERRWQRVMTDDYRGREGDMVVEVVDGYSHWPGFVDLAVTYFGNGVSPVTYDQLVDCPECAFPPGSGVPGLDVIGLRNALEAWVGPVSQARDLISEQAYVTRFFTTISANEMTLDPRFDFNPDLPDVSRRHRATLRPVCGAAGENDGWKLMLDDGTVIEGIGSEWPLDPSDGPAAQWVGRQGTSGSEEVLTDNSQTIADLVSSHNATVDLRSPGCGCTQAPARRAPAGALALVALLSLARRRGR